MPVNTDTLTALYMSTTHNDTVNSNLMPRIRRRFMQRLGVTLMRAQATMLFNDALANGSGLVHRLACKRAAHASGCPS